MWFNCICNKRTLCVSVDDFRRNKKWERMVNATSLFITMQNAYFCYIHLGITDHGFSSHNDSFCVSLCG